jgi:excisionase family DNA binding protein
MPLRRQHETTNGQQAAARLRVAPDTVYELCQKGRLARHRVGRVIRIRPARSDACQTPAAFLHIAGHGGREADSDLLDAIDLPVADRTVVPGVARQVANKRPAGRHGAAQTGRRWSVVTWPVDLRRGVIVAAADMPGELPFVFAADQRKKHAAAGLVLPRPIIRAGFRIQSRSAASAVREALLTAGCSQLASRSSRLDNR